MGNGRPAAGVVHRRASRADPRAGDGGELVDHLAAEHLLADAFLLVGQIGGQLGLVDGAVAAVMAVARAVANDNRKSFLDMDPDELDRLMAEAA